MSSLGAATAAQGRGIRTVEKPAEDYQVVLPHLPTGESLLNTVFLHGCLKARPYRVEHFRDALDKMSLLPEVVALGAYQMNHLWAVTFKDEEGKKKMLATEAIAVKDERCMVIDPCDRGVRLKLYWLLHGVPDDDVRTALAPFGKVTEISRDKWKVKGCMDKGSTTRSVTLKLKVGVTVDDLPHQLRVAEDVALVHVPGRAPLCLRCRGIGHIRRECRVPRCGLCRRYGHDETQCVRSYASVAGPARGDALSEHMMDAADSEEATRGNSEERKMTALLGLHTPCEDVNKSEPQKVTEPDATAEKPITSQNEEKHVENPPEVSSPDGEENSKITDVDMAAASGPGKRTREESEESSTNAPGGSGEPPTKTAASRRQSLKPAPNLNVARRTTSIPPAT
ncbi:uncharacterized protein LOC119385817 [Rhipicephalus sanguineus]|uniref:uncharacterized protein LOC119385817 n=1 Tax=Rhipicephalus sanguineus TaxID=34632 RepID=UPI00189371A0|nr:uncharacterized protein LOC119385817 [Rhipicephalus sanguineus]